MLTTTVPFCLLVAQLCVVWAGSYEGYLANLLARNEAAQEEFRRNNPSGQFVLDYLGSPEFRRFQPLLAESETADTDVGAWDAFLADLAYAADAAAKENPEASAQHLSVAPWTKRPQLNDTPRNVELAAQNHLWGEHRMSGGSSEVGKWVDYAVMGAHAQDDDDTEEEEDNEEGEFSADAVVSPDATRLLGTPFTASTSSLTKPLAHSPSGVKLDQLPAYCDPPNPCPLGYDPDSLPTPCDQNIPNTKEFNRAWIMRKMREGECPCDEEHMEVCPAAKPSFPSAAGFLKSVLLHKPHKLDEVLDGENPYLRGRRRSNLVAKKFGRQKRFRARRHRLNSYLLGRHRNIVKKDGRRGSLQASF
ncbi:Neuroendocrine protein 7B2 [Sparganum proliferum]